MKTYEQKNWPNEVGKAVAYSLDFVSMAYGYGNDIHEDYFKPCCEKTKSVSVHYKDFEFPKTKTILRPYLQLKWLYYAISPELKDDIIAFGIDDYETDVFRPVWTRKHDKPICYSIEPKHILKPIARENNYDTKVICENCDVVWTFPKQDDITVHTEYNGLGRPWYIGQDVLDKMHDFNVTYEYFGPGGYLCREVIVSKRVHDFIIAKYPRAEFRPVVLKNV